MVVASTWVQEMENKKICKLCKKEFIINNIHSKHQVFCSDRCCDREYYIRIRQPKEVIGRKEKICQYCNKTFITLNGHPYQIYCSRPCAQKMKKVKNPEHYKQKNKEIYTNNKDAYKLKSQTWRLKNPEKYKEQMLKYSRANREKAIKRANEWHLVHKDAENQLRKKQGLPLVGQNFKNEMRLLYFVHRLFINYEIMTHHRKWNKWGHHGLELDIYIPDLKLAFEYMGKQHYNKESFERLCKMNRLPENFEYQQYKDRCKKTICKLKGITLIRIKYNEKLSEDLVREKIKYLEVLNGY